MSRSFAVALCHRVPNPRWLQDRFSRLGFAALITLAVIVLGLTGVGFAVPGAQQHLPLTFEENHGQAAAAYSFVMRHAGADIGFDARGLDVFLPGATSGSGRLRLEWVNAQTVPEALELQPGRSNYLLGADAARWLKGVPNYRKLQYSNLYPGVSLLFYGADGHLEHDFVVEPGADPAEIAFRIRGADGMEVTAGGDLAIHCGAETFLLRKPVAYQERGDLRVTVSAGFVLAEGGVVRFQLGQYQRSLPLVIDPVFVFSTYLDGSSSDAIQAVTFDAAGNVYVTGNTASTDFPTQGPVQATLNGTRNIFITKLDPAGEKLIYSTYLGGSGTDTAASIQVDSNGNAVVAGVSTSTDFPHAGAVATPTLQANDNNYFLASLSADGSQLNYSGLIAPYQANYASNGVLALDSSGNAYLAGDTNSTSFPITTGTLVPSAPGPTTESMFTMKVDHTGAIVYSTLFPSSGYPYVIVPYGMVVDGNGQATITGTATEGMPTTAGVVQGTFPNTLNDPAITAGFVLQLNSSASAINYASYLPGTDFAGAIASDASGDLYIVGATQETNLPVTSGAFQSTVGTGYVMEIGAGATTVKAATYLGCCAAYVPYVFSSPMGIALDSNKHVFIAGVTTSQSFPLKYPLTPVFEYTGMTSDMAIAELDSSLSTLLFGSYLSSTYGTYAGSTYTGMAVDGQNNLLIAGATVSTTFPTTPGSFQPQLPSPRGSASTTYGATFLAKINPSAASPQVCLSSYNLDFGTVGTGVTVSQTIQLTNCGNAPLDVASTSIDDPSFSVTQSCGTMAAGAVCPLTVSFKSLRNGGASGTLTITDNASTSPQLAVVSGSGISSSIVPVADPVYVGHQVVGAALPYTLTINNIGGVPLSVSVMSISGAGYSTSGVSCGYVSCAVSIVFTPPTTGTVTGTLELATNDPVNPIFVVNLAGTGDSVYGVPVIAYLDPGTAAINTSPTVNVYGLNLYPASVVNVSGVAQPTTWVAEGQLSFQIPKALLNGIGQLPITVVNPAPGGTSSSVSFAPYQALAIQPSALAYSATNNMLYAAIGAGASTNPNTVIPINPASGATGTPISVGNNPVLLAASDDGKYLYVALKTDQTVQRINLTTSAVERTFQQPTCNTCVNFGASDLRVVPGASQQVVLAQQGLLTLYNDSGLVNSVPATSPNGVDPDFNGIAFVGSNSIYSLPLSGAQCTPNVVALGTSGLSYTAPVYSGKSCNQYAAGFWAATMGAMLYGNLGQVWDTTTQTMTGTFPVTITESIRDIATDPTLPNVYLVGTDETDPNFRVRLVSYSTTSLEETGELTFPNVSYPFSSDLLRWGTDGFAFIAAGAGLTDQEVYLIRSSLAVSQSANPVPVLSGLSLYTTEPTNYTTTVSLYGSGFVPSSVAQWNGTALATTYFTPNQLSVNLQGAQLSSAGTGQITVFNPAPGGGASNAQAFVAVGYQPTATPSATALAFPSVIVGSSSGVQYVTVSNSGWAPLTFSSIQATGDYSFTSTCLANLVSLNVESNCEIAVTFTPTATGTRTGTITITDNAPNSPQTISLTGTGALLTPTVTASASPASITSAQSTTVTVNVSGPSASPVPTGTVKLSGGGYSAQSSLSSGATSFTVPGSSLTSGSDTLTAQYLGDGNYQSGSATTSVTVSPFYVTSTTPSPVTPGGSAAATVTLTAGSSYAGTLNLGCSLSGTPTGAQDLPTCGIKPGSVTVAAGGTATATLTVATTASSSAMLRPGDRFGGWRGWSLAAVFAMGLVFILPGRRRGIRRLGYACVMAALMAGCGGGGSGSSTPSNPGTTAGTYSFTVTATDSGNKLASSTIVQVVVQ